MVNVISASTHSATENKSIEDPILQSGMVQERAAILQGWQQIEKSIVGLDSCGACSRLIASNTSKLNLIQQQLNRKKLLIEALSTARLTHEKHQQHPSCG